MRLREIPVRWGGWKRGRRSFERVHVHFWLSDLSGFKGGGEPLSSPQPGTHYACIGKTCSGTGPVASRRFPGRMPGAARRESGARSGRTSTRHGPLAPSEAIEEEARQPKDGRQR